MALPASGGAVGTWEILHSDAIANPHSEMEVSVDQDQVAGELRRLRTRVRALWCALLGVFVVLGAGVGTEAYFLKKLAHPEQLTLRRLDIVDAYGVSRVILAAPAPAATAFGKVTSRSDRQISGILIADATGTERGGYVTSDTDDANALLTLDAQGHQTVLLLAEPTGSTLFRIWNGKGSLVMGVSGKNPFLNVNQDGKAVFGAPQNNPETTDPRQLFR